MRHAYVAVVTQDGFGIGVADEGIPGYTLALSGFKSYDQASEEAERLNRDVLKLSLKDSHRIAISTMFPPKRKAV